MRLLMGEIAFLVATVALAAGALGAIGDSYQLSFQIGSVAFLASMIAGEFMRIRKNRDIKFLGEAFDAMAKIAKESQDLNVRVLAENKALRSALTGSPSEEVHGPIH